MKLSPKILLEAYQLGFFPMAESRDSDQLVWVKPDFRGVFPLDRFRASKSLRKAVRQERFDVRRDTAFLDVVHACGSKEAGRNDTWINADIVEAYASLFDLGFAHSIECWRARKLVGGLYGVAIGGAFFGESMFSLADNASKVALCHLIARLKVGRYALLDAQFLTPHLMSLGAEEIPSDEYEIRLRRALTIDADFTALTDQASGSSIVQAITHTS